MKKGIHLFLKKGIFVIAAMGFFGLFYPELCMLEDTCKVVYSTANGEEKEILVPEGSDLYYSLLSAEPEEIKIRSKLFDFLSSYFIKDKDK